MVVPLGGTRAKESPAERAGRVYFVVTPACSVAGATRPARRPDPPARGRLRRASGQRPFKASPWSRHKG
jgi:hypothetical protein